MLATCLPTALRSCDRLSWTSKLWSRSGRGPFIPCTVAAEGRGIFPVNSPPLRGHTPLDAGMLLRKQGRVLLRGSHKQQQGGQPNNGPITKDHFNRPQQTPQQPLPGTPVNSGSLQNFSKFSTRGHGHAYTLPELQMSNGMSNTFARCRRCSPCCSAMTAVHNSEASDGTGFKET